ncbi:hypothetical protein EA462_07685 [Natrarchaeobius halalkaliphilus]|uniref:PhiH1 repressor n=1 Tax=Natrarchaeobius halalkaliphilus TaxID=1679091 RepID=A0A3N6P3K4_9EURY|nr:hypothetical protein [Natrarchaeobius halalkaliphilus]RQG89885.1 hypothetical protein EA462_07685 [Natrarchaeobius halalkaliphilus]
MGDDTAEWMDPADEAILEAMRSDDVFSPTHIDEEGICRGPYAAHRCRQLTEHGLLKKYTTGMYAITERGERFLAGELEASDLTSDEVASDEE